LESRIAPAYVGALAGAAATLTGDGASDALVITAVDGFLSHNRFAAGDAGFASAFDFDSTTAGVQKLAADPASTVAIDLGTGTDTCVARWRSACRETQGEFYRDECGRERRRARRRMIPREPRR
jgi:hypothetical protein